MGSYKCNWAVVHEYGARLDPYHRYGQAMGLSFSVPEGVKVPYTLVNIFKEVQKDLACSIPTHGNLQKWVEQVQYPTCA
ncbi:hypothetical protein JHK87_055719 [Glycine soja]|nr:hypothetical protein JHK87_055719 [Glycine soja]